MSTASRVRKSSPIKQGPMRATIPVSSLLRQNTATTTSTSNWRCTSSPDHTNTNNCLFSATTNTNTSSGQRSPGSVSQLYKAKCKTENKGPGNIIRRTASLDTIYLKGQWPRDTYYFHCGLLQVDKATQTEETSSCLVEEKCFYRPRQRINNTSDSTTATTTTNVVRKASPVNIPIIKPIPMIKPPMRNSIEGLNQEIERLVLKGSSPKLRSTNNSNNSMEKEDFELDLHLNLNVHLEQMTPEGHRAPLADLLRSTTRSVNTQTPAEPFEKKRTNSASASASASANVSASTSASDNSSPDDDQLYYSSSRFFSTSPHINRFLAREPPDGCERVNLRFYEDTGTSTLLNPPNVTFQLKPSLGSAFHPLKIHHNTETDDTNTNDIDSSNCINNAQSPG